MNSNKDQATLNVLWGASQTAIRVRNPATSISIVSNAVLIDVDFCAKHDFNTGIQRVVRNTIQNFPTNCKYQLLAWGGDYSYLRSVSKTEELRVTNWDTAGPTIVNDSEVDEGQMILPWNSTLFCPEVPESDACIGLSALAEYSRNSCVAIGYDAIPLTSPQKVTVIDTEKFMKYLSAIKFFDYILCISESTAVEFSGFFSMLASQGIQQGRIVALPLPVEGIQLSGSTQSMTVDKPLILSVGTIEPRKNQLLLLKAARELHRQGLEFSLHYVGNVSPALSTKFLDGLQIAKSEGVDVHLHAGAGDDTLQMLYNTARFSVFISLHEGYGLPVAESLAHGVPVLTSDYGATAEFTDFGGVKTVNPRKYKEVLSALEQLISDDNLINDLRSGISLNETGTWRSYAKSVWAYLEQA